MERDPLDKKALIFEAYRIEGISDAECRSIFLDWALSLPDGIKTPEAIKVFLDRYKEANPDHPMTRVLQAGLAETAKPRRRGGWRSRNHLRT